MKKILFIQPHKTFIGDHKDAFVRPIPSISAMAILGQLKDYDTYFIDASADDLKNCFPYNEHINLIGMNKKTILKRISEISPDIILMNSSFATEYFVVNWLAEIIKENFDTPIIVGGQQASIRPEWHLESENIGSVIRGEGELIIRKVIEDATEGKLRPVYEQERLANLDQPWEIDKIMLRDDSGKTRYPLSIALRNSAMYLPSEKNSNEPTGVLYFSRGCPYGCKYCSAVTRNGREIRHVSLNRMINHIEESIKLGMSTFVNESDAFGIHPLDISMFEYFGELRRQGKDIDIINTNGFFVRYFFENGKISKRKIRLLKNAGLSVITLAVESFDERYNNGKFKGITHKNIKELVKSLRDEGIKTDVYFIVGFPDQTKEEMQKDMELLRDLYADTFTVRILTLFPGAEYYENALVDGKFTEEEYKKEILKGYGFYETTSEFLNLSKVSLKDIKAIIREK